MFKKTLQKWMDGKVFWMVISVLAAICLWYYVTSVETVEGDVTLSLPIQFVGEDALRESRGLILSDLSTETVQVTLQGSRRIIRQLDENNVTAYIDVSNMEARRYSQAVLFQYPEGITSEDVTVTGRRPQYVSFTVDKLSSRVIDVKGEFNGTVAEGYTCEPVTTNPETVEIFGSQEILDQVAYALVTIERDEVSSSISYESTYQLIDNEGEVMDMDGITLAMERVQVSMMVKITKDVGLTVDLIPGGGATAENAVITVEPASLSLSGDAQQLAGINRISLGSVDLALVDGSFEETYTIVLDNGITNESGVTEATVRVEIRGLEKETFTLTNFSVSGLTEGMEAQVVTPRLDVVIRAPAAILEQIRAGDLRGIADLSGVTETVGRVEVPLRIVAEGFSSAGAVGEYKVQVDVSRAR